MRLHLAFAIALMMPSAVAWSQSRTVGAEFQDCPTCPVMVVLPLGRFTMGSPDSEKDREANEGPQRQVIIANPYALGKYEVTVGEFAAFVDATGYTPSNACPVWNETRTKTQAAQGVNFRNHPFSKTTRHPALCVSRENTNAYVAWLAATTKKPYRLPSEAEWEYAARAKYGAENLCARGNVADIALKADASQWPSGIYSCSDGVGFGTAPVGSYAPNAFGLYDMQGNVWEFTQDCYQENYDASSTAQGAVIMSDCKRRTVRGGGWLNGPADAAQPTDGEQRPANRGRNSLGLHFDSMGFRVAVDVK